MGGFFSLEKFSKKIGIMKKLILISLLFLSCTSNKNDQIDLPIEQDSVLLNSQKNLNYSDTIFKKSDSVANEKVIKVVKEIKFLNREVEKFKTERILLESKMNTITQTIITRIDTVFIEVEKNFWGKKKVKTTISSDSSSVEQILDSSQLTQKIDTLQLK